MWDISSFFAALLVYSIGTASPGPGNLSIANTAMRYGRQAGLTLAAGVITGSICWGILTALGISALLLSSPAFMMWLKILGAAYLLWLSFKTVKSAFSSSHLSLPLSSPSQGLQRYYLRGLGLHLSNPKAALTWFTVTSIGLSSDAPLWGSYLLVAVCALMGMVIFGLYAIIFASQAAEKFLSRAKRKFDLLCAIFYAMVAVGFLYSVGINY